MPNYPVKDGNGNNIITVAFDATAEYPVKDGLGNTIGLAVSNRPLSGQYPVKDGLGSNIITAAYSTVDQYPVRDGLGAVILDDPKLPLPIT